MNYVMAKKIILMMNVGLCLSYPVNFAIYCGMSRYSFVYPSSVSVTTLGLLVVTNCTNLLDCGAHYTLKRPI